MVDRKESNGKTKPERRGKHERLSEHEKTFRNEKMKRAKQLNSLSHFPNKKLN